MAKRERRKGPRNPEREYWLAWARLMSDATIRITATIPKAKNAAKRKGNK